MGALCCCMRVVDSDEYENPNSSIYRHRFIRQFLVLYTTVFERRNLRAAPSIQGETPLPSSGLSAGSIDSSFSETFRAPPMPLPYDADRVVSRHEKTSSHIHDESQRRRRGNSISGLESILKTDKFSGSDHEGGFFDRGSTVFCSESSVKHSYAKFTREVAYFLSSSEDEDVCPTCLEEYTPENPKIMTQCSHHYHLSCIYEWMERSETCPVCGKVMVFDETI